MTLILDLDERVDSEELRLEVGRSYAYVGSTLVRTHAAAGEDAPVENTMRMLVKLGTRQYLAAGEEGSDELWNDVMRDWFRNQFRKLGNQALIYNKRQKEIEDGRELAFTWLEVDLQNGTLPVRLRMNDVSGIAEEAADMLSLVRDAYNEGKLGDAATLLACMKKINEVTLDGSRLAVYAYMKHDEDTRNSEYTALQARSDLLEMKLAGATAFVTPELTALPVKTLEALAADPSLSDYDYTLRQLIKMKAHVLSKETETVLSQESQIFDGYRQIFTMIDNADFPFPTITAKRKR